MPFVEESVEQGSVNVTDQLVGQRSASRRTDYQRRIISINNRREQASQLLPKVQMAISLLKRSMLGTHQGAVSHEHLDYYLDRVRVPLQSEQITQSGQTLIPPCAAGHGSGVSTPYRSIVADWDR